MTHAVVCRNNTMLQVSDARIILSLDPSAPGADEMDIPERCCIVKLANSVTYDRCAIIFLLRMIAPEWPD